MSCLLPPEYAEDMPAPRHAASHPITVHTEESCTKYALPIRTPPVRTLPCAFFLRVLLRGLSPFIHSFICDFFPVYSKMCTIRVCSLLCGQDSSVCTLLRVCFSRLYPSRVYTPLCVLSSVCISPCVLSQCVLSSVCTSPCVLSLYVFPSVYTSSYMLSLVYSPPCVQSMLFTLLLPHSFSPSCILLCVYTSLYVFFSVFSLLLVCILLHMYTLPCVHSSMCTPLHVYTPPCVHPSMCTLLHVYTPSCVHSSMCTLLNVYTPPCVHSTVCTLFCVYFSPCVIFPPCVLFFPRVYTPLCVLCVSFLFLTFSVYYHPHDIERAT